MLREWQQESWECLASPGDRSSPGAGSGLDLPISACPIPLGRLHTALYRSHVPALGNIFQGGLYDELADGLGLQGPKLLDQLLQLGL